MTDDESQDHASDNAEAPADDHASEAAVDDNHRTVAPADADAAVESRLGEYLLKGALGLLALIALVATLQFYLSTQTAIARWISHEYRPIFLAAFNLVVLLASGVGITVILRRLSS